MTTTPATTAIAFTNNDRKPRWDPEDTKDTAFELANLMDIHWTQLEEFFVGEDPQKQLRTLARQLQQKIADAAAGPELPSEEEVERTQAICVRAISGIREAVRRTVSLSAPDASVIRQSFGIGVNYRRDDVESVNTMIAQILSALETHKAVADAIKIRAERVQKLKDLNKVLQRWVEANPRGNARKPSPLVQARNQLQMEIEDQVDNILAEVGSNCWEHELLLTSLKDALPSRPYRNTKSEPSSEA